jgi:hypothetical protein
MTPGLRRSVFWWPVIVVCLEWWGVAMLLAVFG